MPYTVLLVDDQQAFLELASQLLNRSTQITVVGLAGSGQEALAQLPQLNPDVVILDMNMPSMNGPQTARQLLTHTPGLCIIMVSSIDDPYYTTLAETAGAVAFLSKRQFSEENVLNILQDESRTGLEGPAYSSSS